MSSPTLTSLLDLNSRERKWDAFDYDDWSEVSLLMCCCESNERNLRHSYWNDYLSANVHWRETHSLHRENPQWRSDSEQRSLMSPSYCELKQLRSMKSDTQQTVTPTANTFESAAELASLFSGDCCICTTDTVLVVRLARFCSPDVEPSILTSAREHRANTMNTVD